MAVIVFKEDGVAVFECKDLQEAGDYIITRAPKPDMKNIPKDVDFVAYEGFYYKVEEEGKITVEEAKSINKLRGK